jgi:hypothetical protein
LEEEEEVTITKQFTAEDIQKRHDYVKKLGEDFIHENFFPIPEELEDKVLYYYYFAIQFVILHCKINGGETVIQLMTDTDERIKECAYITFLDDCYNALLEIVKEKHMEILNRIVDKCCENLGNSTFQYNKHSISGLIQDILDYSEMHSRRAKLNPSDLSAQPLLNSITYEPYDNTNEDHKLWRMLIFNPLKTDKNYKLPDVEEAPLHVPLRTDKEPDIEVPEPFMRLILPQWDKLLRSLHMASHFHDYLYTYINSAIRGIEWENVIDKVPWGDAWYYLTKDFGNVEKAKENESTLVENCVVATINNFSREKKKIPFLIFRISVLRDNLKVLIKY